MDGILIINKEKNYTSRDIVNIIGKKFQTKKVGHTGTLDPMATGVLVLCINRATKLVEILQADEKEYIAEITLGLLTDTLDITGNILKEELAIYTKDEIINAVDSMKGFYRQEVPIYSAIKKNGKKLYEYARNGINISLPKRPIEIKNISVIDDIKYTETRTIFKVKCTVSSGCYIRSLARDIGKKLGTVGIMSELNRTREGIFKIEDSYSLEDIENGNFKLISLTKDLFNYPKIIVDDSLKKRIENGALIENIYNKEVVLFLDETEKLLALYKIYSKDSTLLKPWKMFIGGK